MHVQKHCSYAAANIHIRAFEIFAWSLWKFDILFSILSYIFIVGFGRYIEL